MAAALVLVLVLVLLYFVDFDLRRESNLSMINDELVKSMGLGRQGQHYW